MELLTTNYNNTLHLMKVSCKCHYNLIYIFKPHMQFKSSSIYAHNEIVIRTKLISIYTKVYNYSFLIIFKYFIIR